MKYWDMLYRFYCWLREKIIAMSSHIFHTASLLERLEVETQKENGKATELKKILEARKKLAEARAINRQLRVDIKAVNHQ